MAKFRLGVLALRIETGRYQRPRLAVEERVCKMCSSDEVEDESHFLLRCSLFTMEIHGLIETLPQRDLFSTLPDVEKMEILMNDPQTIKSTAQFLIDSFDKRSLHL